MTPSTMTALWQLTPHGSQLTSPYRVNFYPSSDAGRRLSSRLAVTALIFRYLLTRDFRISRLSPLPWTVVGKGTESTLIRFRKVSGLRYETERLERVLNSGG